MKIFGFCLVLVFGAASARAASPAASSSAACSADPAYARLDFWVGSWRVFDVGSGALVGTSILQKIAGGCAISVLWHEADGTGEVFELFYYVRSTGRWRQVWISDDGSSKERETDAAAPPGVLRLIGTVARPDGVLVLDRSTVTPIEGRRIHQVIEASDDGGKTWRRRFDAEYRRAHDS